MPPTELPWLRIQNRVVARLAEALNLETAAQPVLEAMGKEIGWAWGSLWLSHQGEECLHLQGTWGAPEFEEPRFRAGSETLRLILGEGLPRLAWTLRCPQWVEDLDEDPRIPHQKPAPTAGLKSGFAFPILVQEGVLGVVAFFSGQKREPEKGWSEILADLGRQMGLILELRRDTEALKASLRRLNDLAKNLEDLRHAVDVATIFTVTDTQGVITEVNDRFCRVCGYSREELIGQTHRLLKSGHHPQSLFKEMWETILAGRVWRGEILNRAKDGSGYWADSTIVPILDRTGKPERFIALRTDITERKLAEAALLRRERQLEQLATASRVLNQDLDLPVVMRRLVETGANLAGATSGIYGLVEGTCLRAREYLREGTWEAVDLRFEPGQGVPGWIMVTRQSRLCGDAAQDPQVQRESLLRLGILSYAALPILGRKGEMLGYFGIHNKTQGTFTEEDRTLLAGLAAHAAVAMENTRLVEVLRHEREALRQSEQLYRTLVDRLHEGLAQTDTRGHIIFANPRLGQMLGYPEGEMAGELDLLILTPQPGQAGNPERGDASLPGWRGAYEAQVLRRDGVPLDVLISESPLKDDAGTPLGGLVLVTDNTEHKQAEIMFRNAQKGESLARMAGGIAHDFNNLFQALQGNLELGRAQLRDPQRLAATLERCLHLLGKAASLSGKMLEYSGRGFVHSEGVDLNRLLGHNEGLLRDLAGNGCTLSISPDDPGAEIAGDPHQLLQVVAALVCNAAEAAGAEPVTVRVFAGYQALQAVDLTRGYWPEPVKEGEYVVLSVLDDGSGIDPGLLGKIFDPFFTTKAPGRGLGLSSALGIIRAHQAGLQVSSTPGQGTRVRIFFPPRGSLAPREPSIAPTPAQVPGKRTVLLVDDDEDLRTTLQEVLESLLGYAVLVAKDGLEGVELFRSSPETVDLILMDATMPRMNGREAFDRIKEIRPTTKAILCSGFSESMGQEQAREHGFLGFLKKPFSIQELKEIIEKALA